MARKIAVEIIGDASSLERAFRKSMAGAHAFDARMNKVGSGSRSLLGMAGKVTAIAGGLVGVTSGLVHAAGAGIKFNASMEQNRVAFTNLLGSSQRAKDMLDTLYKLAAHTPFEFPQLVQATQRMLGFGMKAKDVVPTMTAVGDAVSAAGGGSEQIDRVTLALGQMQAKGKVSSEELNQMAESGVPALKLLAEGMHESMGQVQGDLKAGAISASKGIPLIVAGMERHYQGMAEAQGKTFTGQISTIKDTIHQTLGILSKPLFDMLSTKLLPAASRLATVFQTRLAPQIAKLVGELANKLGPKITEVANKFINWLSKSDNQRKILDLLKGAVHNLSWAFQFAVGKIKLIKGAFDVLSHIVGGNKHAIQLLIGAFAGFKILRIAHNIGSLVSSFVILAGKLVTMGATTTATAAEVTAADGEMVVANEAVSASFMGPLGIAAAAVAAAAGIAWLINQIPGWTDAMKSFGGTIYDTAASLGLVNDPMKQFAGSTAPTQNLAQIAIARARSLEAAGLTPTQAAARIKAQFPSLSLYDARVFAGATRSTQPVAHTSSMTINGGVHLHGVHDPQQLADQLHKRANRRPARRR